MQTVGQEKTQNQLSLPLEGPSETGDTRGTIPSVSELTRRVRGLIEGSFLDVWVKGEISNLRRPSSGHIYFVLKDASAQLRSVMFKAAVNKVKFNLQDGMELIAHGRLTVYEARGEYQIVCDTLEPVGLGALQLAFQQLKKKLQAEGLFEAARKRPLPQLPRRIGVVTSPTGAAVRDILKVLSRRFPRREIFVLPAAVQGDKAAPEIVASIQRAARWNEEHPQSPIEVLIVGRGGGSLEDMWPFNEEVVARAIAASPIPIISAVGHEIDFTIADFVADLRAPTPSAAAEVVVPRYDELVYQVETRRDRLVSALRRRLEQLRLHLDHLSQRLVDPRQRVTQLKEAFATARARLNVAMGTRCLLARKRLETATQKLDLLSPLRILSRGFSLVTDPRGAIVRSVGSIRAGDTLQLRFSDGTVDTQVQGVSPAPKP